MGLCSSKDPYAKGPYGQEYLKNLKKCILKKLKLKIKYLFS